MQESIKWVKCRNFPDYLISSNGQVISTERIVESVKGHSYKIKKRKLAVDIGGHGYLRTTVRHNKKRKNKLIHRLMMESFFPVENMENLTVNHKNGIKTDNRLVNLEWLTNEENIRHGHRTGLYSSQRRKNGLFVKKGVA